MSTNLINNNKYIKIAILTLPLHSNYGGIIQNYALQTVLERMGHNVTTINFMHSRSVLPIYKIPIAYTKRFIKKMLGRKDGVIFLERKKNYDKKITEKNVREFINKYIKLTQPITNKEDIKELNKYHFDAFIVGSDQIWRPPYAFISIETAFLDFVTDKKIKKIAYAVSFGTDNIEFSQEQIYSCGQLIEYFDYVSTREKSAINIINNKLKWKCKTQPILTLDPTILLTSNDYLQLINNETKERMSSESGLFYYILDDSDYKNKIIQNIVSKLNCKSYTISPKSKNFWSKAEDKIVPPIEDWLYAFSKADFIFTDSFHGCVFSIIFRKPFLVYGNKLRGMARFDTLLEIFNLKNRLIDENSNIESLINTPIDWDSISNIIEYNKNRSIEFLIQSLS